MKLNRRDNFLFFVGRLEAKKNIERLIKAFLKFHEKFPNWKLLLAGGRGTGFNKILKSAMKSDAFKHVLMPGYVTENEKHVLLKYCNAFVFPSLYEGFGFPILEAFAYGKPVVTSKAASIPEVAGDGAIYVNPHSIESIEEGLVKLVMNPEAKEKSLEAQKAQLEKFKWEDCIDKTIRVLQS
jgi:glycosyltransferase involved in cell wall biosynthesis